ncbi:MAG: putative DNA binding domain-containing protein [Desulfobacteraceae bacterium]|nr:putative DNA binding domain-containing protein [Desulfobacteraceae bacterium]
MQLQDVEKLIRNCESETVEFKLSTGQRTTAAKTLCGMLNGTGGMVLFGVTGKGNPAQPTLFDLMEGGPGGERTCAQRIQRGISAVSDRGRPHPN